MGAVAYIITHPSTAIFNFQFGQIHKILISRHHVRTCSSWSRPSPPDLPSLPSIYQPCGLGQDTPLGNEHHMLSTELLLKLSNQPGLDFLELLQLRHRDEDNDGLLSPTAVNLLAH